MEGPLLVRFLRPPGVVVDLGSSLLAPSPCVLEREGPPPLSRLPLVNAPCTAEAGVWQAGGWRKGPLLLGGLETGATAIRGGGGNQGAELMRMGAGSGHLKGIGWALLPLVPEHPEVQGQRRAQSVPGFHPAATTGTRTGSHAGSLEACALAPEPL